LRPDVAESPPTLGPTGDSESHVESSLPGVGEAFSGAGAAGGLAYRELDRAANGSPEQIRALGDARLLPRPWEPATCRTQQLRSWLDAVVTWLITEYVWEVADTIPACWPQHPHLVHEIAVLAD
jgi:hypothetical protein